MKKHITPPRMSSISSTQQSQPHIIPPMRSRSSAHPSATPHSPNVAPGQVVPGLDFSLSNDNSSPPPTSPPLFRHDTNYAGPQGSQNSLPHTHPPFMVHPSSPFIFQHHPGIPGREASMTHLEYAPPSIIPGLPLHYSYQGVSTNPDPAPSPHQTGGAGTPTPQLPFFPRHPTSPSHFMVPRQASQHHISYPPPGTYSPLGYTTRPSFVYPLTSFVPSPSIYATQSNGSPAEQEDRGKWWYPPPGATTAVRSFEEPESQLQFSLDYPSPVPQHEDEQSQTRTAAPHILSPTSRRFGGPSDPSTDSSPSSLPASSTSSLRTGTTKTPSLSESRSDWPQERRSYHPKSPAHRSEWVMWVGNVPRDGTLDELRAFFNRPLPPQSSSQSGRSLNLPEVYGGVSSVYLIARSNCAFVNFDTEAQLGAAIARFHGKPIRPNVLPCPRLVCRVRKRADDLKAGVGAQRGCSMHVNWVKEQREGARHEGVDPVGLAKAIGLASSLSTSDDGGQGRSSAPCSSGSSSPSTDSGILSRYFPQRYFILKSLAQHDLDLSVQRNVWATQKHNEEILDQAYRTSKDVFLIFGVNKSGEFYGYARMAGPILQSEDRVPWASRPTSSVPVPQLSASDMEGNVRISPPAKFVEGGLDPHYVFPPEEDRVVEQSPKDMSHPQEGTPFARVQVFSTPAGLHEPRQVISRPSTNAPHVSLPFELSADAMYSNIRDTADQSIHQAAHPIIPASSDESEDILEHARDTALQIVNEEIANPKEGLNEVWGRPFSVGWIRTEHLSFTRTRHLRNPWNQGREVKISRDGTELEPSIGRQLLEEWDTGPPPSPADIPAASSYVTQRRRSS